MKNICYDNNEDCMYYDKRVCLSEFNCSNRFSLDDDIIGYEEGDICNRNGCLGDIQEYEKAPCYCHTGHPPCSSCTDPRAYCDECGWDEKEESDAIWQRNYEERKKIEEARKKEKEEMKEFIKTVPDRLVKLFGYEENI